jgi:predicted AAA+ superfamily ATPase
MKRHKTSELLKWHKDPQKKPLILRGARQVGKSTLVRIFALENQLELIEINLEKHKFKSLTRDNFYLDDWKIEIEIITGKKITKNSIIFLDEIQAQPEAIAKLRYFYEEDPQSSVVVAGSLLEIVLHQEEISFPVGRVSFMWLSPMTFTEYLEAIGRTDLVNFILRNTIPLVAHDILKDEVMKYFFIGGMPKAIQTFLDTKSFLEVRKVQEEIISAYSMDFPKYEKRAKIDSLNSIFKILPFHLGKKVIYQHFDRNLRSGEIKKSIELFIRANILYPCYHTNATGVPLLATVDHSIFKLYFLDIGLVNCAQQLSWHSLQELFFGSFVSKGFLAEQFIAQHLAYDLNPNQNPELLFWLKDKSVEKAEVDFIVGHNNKIIPIEVKAGKGGRLKSMAVLSETVGIRTGIKFSAEFFHQDKIRINGLNVMDIENWPYYAVEGFLEKLK